MSTIDARERARDRDWDARSSYSTRDDNRAKTTVKRYRYGGEDESRSRYEDDGRDEIDVRVTRRERSPSRDRGREKSEVRRYEASVARGDYDGRQRRDQWRESEDDSYREIVINRERSRDPPRHDRDDYDIDRYTRTTDYYARPERRSEPQTIVIHNEAPQPIFIREPATRDREVAVREKPRSPSPKREEPEEEETKAESLAVVERKSEAPSRREEAEEDYYYQRTTREIARRNREDVDDREYRRERPRDSVADFSRGRDRDYERDYYYKKTVEEDGSVFRGSSPHHGRHLAEGALVGAGAAALLANRDKRNGRSRSRAGTVGKYVGGAALGTIGAELVTRARSRKRSEAREEEYDYARDDRGRDNGRDGRRGGERSRSHSAEGNNKWAKLAGVAALGALAGYAATRPKGGKDDDRRSRSRRRRSSVGRRGRSSSSGGDDARNPHHRNSVIAKAGLASAAVAGLVEHARNKSKGPGARSKSRVRQGLPIAATGLAGAAAAALYENRKAKKEGRSEGRRGRSASRGYSRSPSRSVAPHDEPRGARGGDANMIEYGHDPLEPAADREHGRPHSRGESAYEHGGRNRSIGSPGGSPQRCIDRSGDYGPEAATAGGAGMAGVAAHEASKKRERLRAERERRQMEEEPGAMHQAQGGYASFGPYGQGPPEPVQYQDTRPYYEQHGGFAPPAGSYSPAQGQPTYGGYPQQGGGGGGAGQEQYGGYQPPMQQPDQYHQPNDNRYHGGTNVSTSQQSPQQQQRYVPERYRSDVSDDNISPMSHPPAVQRRHEVRASRDSGRRESKSVAFNADPVVHDADEHAPTPARSVRDTAGWDSHERNRDRAHDDNDDDYDDVGRGEDGRGDYRERDVPQGEGDRNHHYSGGGQSNNSSRDGPRDRHGGMDGQPQGDRRRRRRRRHSSDAVERGDNKQRDDRPPERARARSHSPGSDASGATVDLPDRFDSQGRRIAERGDNPLADKIGDLLSGGIGRLFGGGSSGGGGRR